MVDVMRYAKVFPVVLAIVAFSLSGTPAHAQARRAGPPAGGRAVPRSSAPVVGHPIVGSGHVVVAPFRGFYPGYYYPSFSFGIGIYGGYPFGYPYYGYYGYPYGPGYYGAYYGYPYAGYPYAGGPYAGGAYAGGVAVDAYGGLRIEDAPKDAQVYADGYYVGVVDDFDGAFQHMNLTAGVHKIEIRPKNSAPISFDVQIQPGQTITYRADLPRN